MRKATHERKNGRPGYARRVAIRPHTSWAPLAALVVLGVFVLALVGHDGRASAQANPFERRSTVIDEPFLRDELGRLRVVPDEIILRFEEDLLEEDSASLIREAGMRMRRHLKGGGHLVVSLPRGVSIDQALAWFRGRPGVQYAAPNHLIYVQDTPNDSRFLEQWGLEKIQAVAGWNIAHASSEVVVAVIDTGVDYHHTDLAANIWENLGEIPGNGVDDDGNGYVDDVVGWDFVGHTTDCSDTDCKKEDNDPSDGHGHGTHVAGILGAVTNNAEGIAGAAWNCTVMPLRAGYKQTGGSGVLSEGDAAAAIEYAADNGAMILNLSWGDTVSYPAVRAAVSYAEDLGVLICAAAGNNGTDTPFYPAAYPNEAIIAVGSTTQSDKKASTSNYGDWVDLFAPGDGVLSTCLNNSYCLKSGTSMATAYVSGLAAILFSRYPGWSPLVIKAMIVESADFLPGLQIGSTSAGRMNILSSLVTDTDEVATLTDLFSVSYGRMDCHLAPLCEGDADQDGDVDGGDLASLVGNLLLSYPP